MTINNISGLGPQINFVSPFGVAIISHDTVGRGMREAEIKKDGAEKAKKHDRWHTPR